MQQSEHEMKVLYTGQPGRVSQKVEWTLFCIWCVLAHILCFGASTMHSLESCMKAARSQATLLGKVHDGRQMETPQRLPWNYPSHSSGRWTSICLMNMQEKLWHLIGGKISALRVDCIIGYGDWHCNRTHRISKIHGTLNQIAQQMIRSLYRLFFYCLVTYNPPRSRIRSPRSKANNLLGCYVKLDNTPWAW